VPKIREAGERVLQENVNGIAGTSDSFFVPDSCSRLAITKLRDCLVSNVFDHLNQFFAAVEFLLEMVEPAIVRYVNIVWNSQSISTFVPISEGLFDELVSVNVNKS